MSYREQIKALDRSMSMQKSVSFVTLSFFRFGHWRDRLWGFRQMAEARSRLREVPGLTFFRLLGTGSGDGFSTWPDTQDIGVLHVWQDRTSAARYFNAHALHAEFVHRSQEQFRLDLLPEFGHGKWAGKEPFVYSGERRTSGPVAVITRATIRRGALLDFWRSVPAVRGTLARTPSLLFAEGIGEWPLVQQATFTVWRDVADMLAFAYASPHHQKAVADTRKRGWFSEELFARFTLAGTHGTWGGTDPLELVTDQYLEVNGTR